MLLVFIVAALAKIIAAVPNPQGIEIPSAVLDANPVLFTPPLDVISDIPKVVITSPLEPITTPDLKIKRDPSLIERDGSCASQPAGSGPHPTPDTPSAFLADPDLQVFLAPSLMEIKPNKLTSF